MTKTEKDERRISHVQGIYQHLLDVVLENRRLGWSADKILGDLQAQLEHAVQLGD